MGLWGYLLIASANAKAARRPEQPLTSGCPKLHQRPEKRDNGRQAGAETSRGGLVGIFLVAAASEGAGGVK
eukprot:6127121-Pyramimonas_sp.AAC.1